LRGRQGGEAECLGEIDPTIEINIIESFSVHKNVVVDNSAAKLRGRNGAAHVKVDRSH
jgi:hypothetical protein